MNIRRPLHAVLCVCLLSVSGLGQNDVGVTLTMHNGLQAVSAALAPSTDSSEPTWTDPATGLTWTRKDNTQDISWNDAKGYCSSLKLGGIGDWRLPTIEELNSVYDPTNAPKAYIKGKMAPTTGAIWSNSTANVSGDVWAFGFSPQGGGRESMHVDGGIGYMRALCVTASKPTAHQQMTGIAKSRTPATVQAARQVQQASAPSTLTEYELGIKYVTGNGVKADQALAIFHMTNAANTGVAAAQQFMGMAYLLGNAVPLDNDKAAYWFSKASDQGLPAAEVRLAQLLDSGKGVPQDHRQAVLLLQRASDTGDTSAQFELGLHLITGSGIQANYSGAVDALQRAASGYTAAANAHDIYGKMSARNAMHQLGLLFYMQGRGVQMDVSQSEEWFRKALADGYPPPDKDLAFLVQHKQELLIQQMLVAQQKPTQQQEAARPQALAQQVADDSSERQSKISQLESDIQSQEQNAEADENSANQLLNNCSGPGAALCQALGQAGAARLRQKAAEARNQADSDREEIERLQGEEVQNRQRRDTTYGGSLQQVTTETGTNIQSAAAQQQANLQAMAAATQQRQQAQAQQPAPSTSATAARSSSVNTATTAPAINPAAGPAPSGSGNNPYSSAPAQGSYNPYTGTGSGSIQGNCTDMTGLVKGTVKIGSDGFVIGYLTNNSNQTLYIAYTFKQNGVPSNAMANAGGTTVQGGQTVGGELQGLYSTGADKNSPEIYWYAVLKSDQDRYGCAHKW
jgi:TPR repeat protein